MTKFLSVLAVSAALVSAAEANKIQTGAYIGANVGMNSSKINKKTHARGTQGALGGLYAGYGIANCNVYYGAELGLMFEDHKYKISNTFSIKRELFVSLAARLGFLVNPSTMIYGRVGFETGSYKLPSDTDLTQKNHYSKTAYAFAPGLGLETAVSCNLMLRTEWVYQMNRFKPKSIDTAVKFKKEHDNSHRFTVGIAYRF